MHHNIQSFPQASKNSYSFQSILRCSANKYYPLNPKSSVQGSSHRQMLTTHHRVSHRHQSSQLLKVGSNARSRKDCRGNTKLQNFETSTKISNDLTDLLMCDQTLQLKQNKSKNCLPIIHANGISSNCSWKSLKTNLSQIQEDEDEEQVTETSSNHNQKEGRQRGECATDRARTSYAEPCKVEPPTTIDNKKSSLRSKQTKSIQQIVPMSIRFVNRAARNSTPQKVNVDVRKLVSQLRGPKK